MLRGGYRPSERRRHLSDSLSWQQDQALSSSIYLLRQMGPTGFLLREEAPEHRDFRVTTAPRASLVPPGPPGEFSHRYLLPGREAAFQLGLVEGEITDLLRGIHRVQTPQPGTGDETAHVKEDGYIKQKEIDSEDICSICQEVLLEKKLPVTFCRFGCGNNFHIKCMKILANYQNTISNTSTLKCPLCRKEFAPLKLVLEEFQNATKLVTTSEKERLNKHLGIPCNNCKQFPIEGKCYKCTECIEYHLCQECFDSCYHLSHTFIFREKRNQRWRSLDKRLDEGVKYLDVKNEIEEELLHVQEKQG
ncbi:E3 ubiquitin-protein ligase ZSWIM2 [Sciurus carolinensis]|uniref:E3 ubiquitin-protein ligase ZSWIM2 n=1 Tax=Sciurus carolinensis TaxID=30640 RepID=A0AA41NIJ9_SCICA|nr:E3 ubiquitin-protein ligase ZSWIM2 [Sciurus carolinensis]